MTMRFQSFEHLTSFRARTSPEAPAILREGGDRPAALTWAELEERIARRCGELRGAGKTCLAVFADGSLDCVTTVFAAVRAGLQVVMLDDSLPDAAAGALLRYTDADMIWSADGEREDELASFLTPGVTDGKGKILFFTSGTTEQSKAVVLTERSLCASAWNGSQMLPLRREDVLLCVLPLGHVFGFVCGLLWGLSEGACVALGRGARHYADDLRYFRPTAVSAVPLLLGFFLRYRLFNEELRLVLIGAGNCPRELLDGAAAAGVRVAFGYGLTETSSGVAISTEGDPYAMAVCPDDVITLAPDGEILIEAPTCMMQGYYKREADTAAVLTGGVFRTGDLGRFDEKGKLHITGRKKDMLVLSDGTKLFLPEYEGRLSALLGTGELAVFLEGNAPALLLQDTERDEKAVRAAIRPLMEELPRGRQIGSIWFSDDPMPRTATGKIRRWELETIKKEKRP